MRERIRYFVTANEGATAIEFAIVFPVFILVVMGTMEFSLMLYQRSAIERVSHEVIRRGQVRNVRTNGIGRNVFLSNLLKERIASAVITGYKPENLSFSTRVYENFTTADEYWSCSSARQSNVCFGQHGHSRITELTVKYTHEFVTPLAILANGLSSELDITATGFLKREAPLR